jgi:hypothetical protein
LAIPNPFERHPRDANQYPDSECPGCPPGFVFDKRRGMCVPYVMHDPVTWIGSTSPGCSPGWSSARVDLVTGEILPRLAPVEREKQTMICIPILSTNFGRR